MPQTYTGVLTGDRIEWTGDRPPDGPVRVEAVPPTAADDERRRIVREALEALAAGGRINAAEWERERNELEGYEHPRRGTDDAG